MSGPPRVLLLAGLPGVGKTTLARHLAPALDAAVLNRDDIRDRIFPERYLDYGAAQNEVATRTLLGVLGHLLAHFRPPFTIVDGKPFSRRREVRAVHGLVTRRGAALAILHCVAPPETVAARLERDLGQEERHVRARRNPGKAEVIRRAFEPIDLPHLVVDTSGPPEAVAAACLARLGHR